MTLGGLGRTGRLALAMAGIVLVLALSMLPIPVLSLDGPADRKVSQAFLVQADGTDALVSLPQQWISPYGSVTERHFHVTKHLETMPGEDLFLYVPYFEQKLQVFIGGQVVHDSTRNRLWAGPMSYLSALVRLPAKDLRKGSNRIDIKVLTGPMPSGTLSPIYIGQAGSFEVGYRLRSLMEERLKPIFFGIQAFLAFISLGLFYYRRKDHVFGWLGATMLCACVLASGILMSYVPAIANVFGYLFVMFAPLTGYFFLGFSLALIGRRMPPLLTLVTGTVILTSLAVLILQPALVPGLGYGMALPTTVLFIAGSMILVVEHALRERNAGIGLFAFAQALLLYGMGHNIAQRLGLVGDGFLISQTTHSLVLIGTVIFLMRRQAVTANSLDLSAQTLRLRLAEKEAELTRFYNEQQASMQQQAIETERRRIMADLHDGVAANLATIVALSESSDDVTSDIQRSARDALVDLRLVLDALSLPESDLGYALGSFRERCLQPLDRLGIEVKWSMMDLAAQPPLSREAILSILRILQEATNNAVRHGNPETLRVVARRHPEGWTEVRVENRGGIAYDPETAGCGMGLANMRRRAVSIGGSISLEPLPDGAILRLCF